MSSIYNILDDSSFKHIVFFYTIILEKVFIKTSMVKGFDFLLICDSVYCRSYNLYILFFKLKTYQDTF